MNPKAPWLAGTPSWRCTVFDHDADQTPREKVQKWGGIAGHIEQAERGSIHKSQQAHKNFCPLLPTAMVFVSYGFVLVQVQVYLSSEVSTADHFTLVPNERICPLHV